MSEGRMPSTMLEAAGRITLAVERLVEQQATAVKALAALAKNTNDLANEVSEIKSRLELPGATE